MPDSITSPETLAAFAGAAQAARDPDPSRRPFPSPSDWRDQPIYFLLVDRFNNPISGPNSGWDQPTSSFQGGSIAGVRAQLDYIKEMGFGALWISPVQANLWWDSTAYHGYGIHDFLTIAPHFASDPGAARANPRIVADEFRQLVDHAHDLDLYIILDVVINHVGNVFGYDAGQPSPSSDSRPWMGLEGSPYTVFWRDATGLAQPNATVIPGNPSRGAVVWPREFQQDEYFRRRGSTDDSHPEYGDFAALKELVTEYKTGADHYPVRDLLIRAYQYIIARFDVDGFRIDTLKYVEDDFARVFGNSIREYALSIGKHNFFTFGEVTSDEAGLARFIGRDSRSTETGEPIGIDAALDFPLRDFLAPYVKARGLAPTRIVQLYEQRKEAQRTLITTHGEASQHFVTFLDNHDNHDYRFSPVSVPGGASYDPQFALGTGCLMTLQGIPCIYYGTEYGLSGLGQGTGDSGVREALWGMPHAFEVTASQKPKFYQVLRDLLSLRSSEPALRYGRQYIRPLSGDGKSFAVSDFPDGVLAFSRVLNDREVVVIANANTTQSVDVRVIVDAFLNPDGQPYRLLYSNRPDATGPGNAETCQGGDVVVRETNGKVNWGGPARAVRVQLKAMEIQVISQ